MSAGSNILIIMVTFLLTVGLMYMILYFVTGNIKWPELLKTKCEVCAKCEACKCESTATPSSSPSNATKWYDYPGVWYHVDPAEISVVKTEDNNTLEKAKQWVMTKTGGLTCGENKVLVLIWAEAQGSFSYGMGTLTTAKNKSDWESHILACTPPVLPTPTD